MTAVVIKFPLPAKTIIHELVSDAITGKGSQSGLFGEDLQDELLYVLDTVFDGNIIEWAEAVVRVILTSNEVAMNVNEALSMWTDVHISRTITDECEQFS